MEAHGTALPTDPLRAALDQLARREWVLGALLIALRAVPSVPGSLPAEAFTPTSDYDLVVVLDEPAP